MNYWLENEVLFYYERGPGFATLHDNRPLEDGSELQARKIVLNEVQSRIYLFCDGIQGFRSIQQMPEMISHRRNAGAAGSICRERAHVPGR